MAVPSSHISFEPSTVLFVGGPNHGQIMTGSEAANLLLMAGFMDESGSIMGKAIKVTPQYLMNAMAQLGMQAALEILAKGGINPNRAIYRVEPIDKSLCIMRYVGEEEPDAT